MAENEKVEEELKEKKEEAKEQKQVKEEEKKPALQEEVETKEEAPKPEAEKPPEQPLSKKKKKINKMSLEEIEVQLQIVKEKMGGFDSIYAQHLLRRKEILTSKK